MKAIQGIFSAVMVAVLWFLAGCVNLEPTRDTVRWHLLQPAVEIDSEESPEASEERAWFVRSVRLPDYLQGNRMLYYSKERGVVYAERNFWAEPFADGVGRFFASELAQTTGQMVAYHPVSRKSSGEVGVLLSFSRLDPVEGKGLVVDVMVEQSFPAQDSSRDGNRERQRYRFVYGDGDYAEASRIVADIEAALTELARRVAAEGA